MRYFLFVSFFIIFSGPLYASEIVSFVNGGITYSAECATLSCADVKTGFSGTGVTVSACSADPVVLNSSLFVYLKSSWVSVTVTNIQAPVSNPVSGSVPDPNFWGERSALNALIVIGLVLCFGAGYCGGRLR